MRREAERGYFIRRRRDWTGPWARAIYITISSILILIPLLTKDSFIIPFIGGYAVLALCATAHSAHRLRLAFIILAIVFALIIAPLSMGMNAFIGAMDDGEYMNWIDATAPAAATVAFILFAWLLGRRGEDFVTGREDDDEGPDKAGVLAPLSPPPGKLAATAAKREPKGE
jgi:hypothetical protein